MSTRSLLSRCRSARATKWLGAALIVWLLLAESLTVAHSLDRAAHDGGACAVCVGAASFGAAAPPEVAGFEPVVAILAVAVAAAVAFVSIVPTRRHARGPPAVSFTPRAV